MSGWQSFKKAPFKGQRMTTSSRGDKKPPVFTGGYLLVSYTATVRSTGVNKSIPAT